MNKRRSFLRFLYKQTSCFLLGWRYTSTQLKVPEYERLLIILATYGVYNNSLERKGYLNEKTEISYTLADSFGMKVMGRNETLYRKNGLCDLRGTDVGLSFFALMHK